MSKFFNEHENLLAERVRMRQMLAGRCVFVGDRWFGEAATQEERASYLRAYNLKQERNARRRILRNAFKPTMLPRRKEQIVTGANPFGAAWLEHDYLFPAILYASGQSYSCMARLIIRGVDHVRRNIRRAAPGRYRVATESLTEHDRLAIERRKICRRSTLNPAPTAIDIRVAWHISRKTPEGRIELGNLLNDLESFVRNDLKILWIQKRPQIVSREPGIRGWIAEHCPELSAKYKTLMRYKALSTRLRQESGWLDPLGPSTPGPVHPNASAHVQPRARGRPEPRRHRRPWEFGDRRIDARGRPFVLNENYSLATPTPAQAIGLMGDMTPPGTIPPTRPTSSDWPPSSLGLHGPAAVRADEGSTPGDRSETRDVLPVCREVTVRLHRALPAVGADEMVVGGALAEESREAEKNQGQDSPAHAHQPADERHAADEADDGQDNEHLGRHAQPSESSEVRFQASAPLPRSRGPLEPGCLFRSRDAPR